MSQPYAIGLDIGGTKIAGAAVFTDARLGTVYTVPTPGSSGPQAILAAATAVLDQVLDEVGSLHLLSVGVGSAGTIDAATGTVVAATDVLANWTGTNIKTYFTNYLGTCGLNVPVAVENDVNAHALGEMWLGAGKQHASALIFAVGTGVGGAAMSAGQLIHGAHHAGGDLGHIPVSAAGDLPCTCQGVGHLEAVSAGPAIARQYGGPTSHDARVVFAAAANGDALAQAVLDRSAAGLGQAMAAAAAVLDPEIIIVGGGVAEASTSWLDHARAEFERQTHTTARNIPIVTASLGSQAALYGAAFAAGLRG